MRKCKNDDHAFILDRIKHLLTWSITVPLPLVGIAIVQDVLVRIFLIRRLVRSYLRRKVSALS